MSAPALAVRDLWVRYGNVPAVRGLSFEVGTGEVVAILGPNGAGKSSTMAAVMGKLGRGGGRHGGRVEGAIDHHGRSLVGMSPDSIARAGIALVPEGRHIFGDLTVEENLRLGALGRRSPDGVDADREWALELFPIVGEFLHRQAGLLSGGQQQQLAIARALVAGPDVLLLDEPSLGLAPTIIDTVFDALTHIRERGRTIVIVEQRAARTAAFADRSHVIANGELRLTLDADTPNLDEAIAAAYFGS